MPRLPSKKEHHSPRDLFESVFNDAVRSSREEPDELLTARNPIKRSSQRRRWNFLLGWIAGSLPTKADRRFDGLFDAVRALRDWHNDPNSVGPLRQLLDDRKDEIRAEAFRVMLQIGGAGDASLREHLWSDIGRGLSDSVPEVRRLMLSSLQWFAQPNHSLSAAASEAALCMLRDSEATVRSAAVRALRAFELERVLPAFEKVVPLTRDDDPAVRRETCDLLGGLEVDALRAVLPLVGVVAYDPDRQVRKAGIDALCRIDPSAEWVDLGPDDVELRSKLIHGLVEAGESARAFRRSLEARWRWEGSPKCSSQMGPVPPEVKDVWQLFSPEECELLRTTWLHRLADGIKKCDLFRFLGMGRVTDKSDNLFRTRLSNIRRMLRAVQNGGAGRPNLMALGG
jgi:hypothetical protein